MPEIKRYLKNLVRVSHRTHSRYKFLRLDMNESVSGLPSNFLKKVFSKVNSNFTAAYPEYDNLVVKLAKHNKIKKENICLSNGSDAAIKYIFDAYINSGDKVLVTDPTFAMYPVYCKMFNAQIVPVKYGKDQDLNFPFKDFYEKLTKDIKMAVIVNPNNPTGTVIDESKLDLILKKAKTNNILLIIDEAYFYFYPKTVIRKIDKYKNLIVLRTFSKLCGIAAARIGYASACKEIINNLTKIKPTYDVSGLAVLLAENILDEPGMIKKLILQTNEGKKFLYQKLTENKIEFKKGFANFVLIKGGYRSEEIVSKLAKRGILVGRVFKQHFLRDYIRVTLGAKLNMEKFWENFISIWNKGRND